jgi:hypothetical protein
MACSREITAVMLYDSTNQFHVASPCQALSVGVTSHYYTQSRVLVPRVRFDGVSYGLDDTAWPFFIDGYNFIHWRYVDREEVYCLRRRLKLCTCHIRAVAWNLVMGRGRKPLVDVHEAP